MTEINLVKLKVDSSLLKNFFALLKNYKIFRIKISFIKIQLIILRKVNLRSQNKMSENKS